MVDLNGHEAGNGGHSQGKPTAYRDSSTRRDRDFASTRYYYSHMRLLFVVLVLLSTHLAAGQENTFRRSLEFVGCYELRVPGAHPSNAKKTDDVLPKRFQLMMRTATNKDGFVARDLDSKAWDSSMMALLSFWNTNLDGTLHIVWSTGYVGYDVPLSGSGPELRGTAHYFTDTNPLLRTNRDTAIMAQRVGCKESAK
jgi:hypothetical protein